MKKLVDIPKAAEMLGGVSHWTIRGWINAGRLQPTKVGRRVMLSEDELERFLESCQPSSTAHPSALVETGTL